MKRLGLIAALLSIGCFYQSAREICIQNDASSSADFPRSCIGLGLLLQCEKKKSDENQDAGKDCEILQLLNCTTEYLDSQRCGRKSALPFSGIWE